MLYAKITNENYGTSYIESLDTLMEALIGEFESVEEWAELGDKFTIEFVEMSAEEYEKLGEFVGW
jgi:hypothetical protein